MNISAARQMQTTVVSIQGSIDATTASQVTSFLSTRIAENETRLIVDLAQVGFMSSAGLRAFLATLKESRQHGGDLRLAAAQPGVEKILKMSGFTNILKTFVTVDEAVKSFDA
jgi:anti-sigma B factor antagonist